MKNLFISFFILFIMLVSVKSYSQNDGQTGEDTLELVTVTVQDEINTGDNEIIFTLAFRNTGKTETRGGEISISYIIYGSTNIIISEGESIIVTPSKSKPLKIFKRKIKIKLNDSLKSTYVRIVIDALKAGSLTKEFIVN